MNHPGVEKTKTVSRPHRLWPGLDQTIARLVPSCQVSKENKRALRHVEITPWSFPERPWSRLHVDFGGPFNGHYIVMVVDALSKWVELGAPGLADEEQNPIRRMMVPPYHLAPNGSAERVVQTVKDKLKNSKARDFRTLVCRVLFQCRTTLATPRAFPLRASVGPDGEHPVRHVVSRLPFHSAPEAAEAEAGC
ncbi:uncharacterized protein LOC144143368 [Haemaphysalis longicornis]